MLVRVELTGKDQRGKGPIHTEDVREELLQAGVPADWIRVQTATQKELDDTLGEETNQVRVIITKDALREGWDCPFAYVLALLSKTQAKTALTQMIGRVLRQPGAKRTGVDDLDSAWVFCADLKVKDAVESIRKGLDEEGMGDLRDSVRANAKGEVETRRAERRTGATERILVPRVTHALAWWWRLASRGEWGLQGWRRHKVYPDFLMRFSGDGDRLMVLETKGKQLDNDDTAFKRDLMKALGAAFKKPAKGEVELFDDSPDTIRFKMLMQELDWKTELQTALA